MSKLQETVLSLDVDGADVSISCLTRDGRLPPFLCLHGFGSTKEDYADLALHPRFQERGLIMYDAPGFGASAISDPAALSIPFLRNVATAVCDALNVDRFHLSGHSMGGLTALLLAAELKDRVLSFSDVEGNLAEEDCFLSRQIFEHPADSGQAFLDGFIDRVARREEWSARLYVRALKQTVQPESIAPVFRSMVDLSETAPLMKMFFDLPCPQTFIHGEQNKGLTYLPELRRKGVRVESIPYAAHFPMYSNAPALWDVFADVIEHADAQ